MRQIGILSDPTKVQEVSRLFTHFDIRFTIDCQKCTSWDKDSYGQPVFTVFVEDEDDIDRAISILETATSNASKSVPRQNFLTGPCEHAAQNYLQQRFGMLFETKPVRKTSTSFFTLLLAILCITVFILDLHSRHEVPQQTFSPMQRILAFDYPQGLQIKDKLLESQEAEALQKAPQTLLVALKKTAIWGGLYPFILEKERHSDALPKKSFDTTLLLEKVRAGEAWRLVSPCVLHGDIFHLTFNILWLIALGVQVEKRLSIVRFTLLLLIIAIFSNAAQYCMSGPNFYGCSGVIFGLLGFIAKRNEVFPWEGYSLQSSAYSCVLFFMWALVFLSFCSFLAAWYLNAAFPIGFANTAHVAGLLAGIQLGKTSFFSAKKNRNVV